MPVCCGTFRTAAEPTDDLLTHSSKVSNDSELSAERCSALNEPEHLQEEREEKEEEGGKIDCRETEREEQYREQESKRDDEKESNGEERGIESRCYQMCENEVEGKGRNCKKKEADTERRKTDSRNGNIEESEEDVENTARSIHEDEEREERRGEGGPGVERSIQVMDGHIPVGSVQWKGHRAKAAGRAQV